jgi:aspartyl protease
VRAISLGASVGAAVVLAVGCGAGARHSATTPTGTGAVVTPSGHHLSKLSTAGTPHGEQTVKIQVVATSSRPTRQALALVPVYIDGRGPFRFALDTGASRSLISAALAARLHLPSRGSAGMLQGVTGAASAENFAVSRWRAGNVSLPPSTIAAIGSPAGAAPPAGGTGTLEGPVGLLGSDVLSRYGKIAIDYDKGLLVLDPPVK